MVDVSAYMNKPIKITVDGGVIDGVNYVVGGVKDSFFLYPQQQDYTNSITNRVLVESTFNNKDKTLALNIIAPTPDYVVTIESGSEENPFDFTKYSLDKGNIVYINQKNDGVTATYSKVKLTAGDKYFVEGNAQNFKIIDPFGEDFYVNDIRTKDEIDGTTLYRGNSKIGVILEPTISGEYILTNKSPDPYGSYLEINVYGIQYNPTIERDIVLSRLTAFNSVDKAYAIEPIGGNAYDMQIKQTPASNKVNWPLADVSILMYYDPQKTYNWDYIKDDIADDYINSRIYMKSGEILRESIYSNKEYDKAFVVKLEYYNQPSYQEDTTFKIKATKYKSEIGRISKAELQQLKAEEREASLLADPVDVFKGNFIDTRNLLLYSGISPLELTMNYDSIANDSKALAGGFTHNFETYLEKVGNDIRIHLDPNKVIAFTPGINGYETTHSKREQMSLDVLADGYRLTKEKNVYLFTLDGKLTSFQNTQGIITYYSYLNENLSRVENNKGQFFDFVYEKDKLLSVSDKEGRTISFTYNADKSLLTNVKMVNGSNFGISYQNTLTTENPDFKVSKLAFADTTLVENWYNPLGAVIKQEDGRGKITTFSYDETSDTTKIITKVTEPDGFILTKAHDLNGNVVYDIDKEGNQRFYSYDEINRKIEEIDSLGNTTKYEYNTQNLISKIIFPDLSEQTLNYDETGNITEVVTQDGLSISNVYENNRLIQSTNKNGIQTNYEYNSFGEVTRINEGGFVSTFEYDEQGYLVAMIDKTGNRITYENDSLGRVIKTTLPDGKFTTNKYDASNNIIETINMDGKSTTYEYNSFGNKTKEIDVLGNITTYSYDANGNRLKEMKDSREIIYAYDYMNRLIEISKYGFGSKAKTFTYSPNGNLIKEKDESGIITTYLYDKNGNNIEKTIGSIKETYAYDILNQLTSRTDGKGNKTVYVRNSIGLLTKEISPAGNVSEYTYDKVGNLLSIKDAKGFITANRYDNQSNLIQTTDAIGNITKFTYNPNNQLISSTNAKGEIVTNEYNALGQLVTVKNALNETVQEYLYNAQGKPVQITDGNGHARSYEYDALGNLIAEYDAKGNLVTQNQYNSFNELIQATDSLGYTEKWEYSGAGVISSNTNKLGAKTLYNHNPDGRLMSTTNPLNTSHAQQYTTSGALSAVRVSSYYDTNYYYDEANRLIQEKNPRSYSIYYAYDSEDNLIQTTNARSQKTTYEYDVNGNTTKAISPEGTTTYTYNALNQLVTSESKNANTSYTYDELGRVISKMQNGKTVEYVYDVRGHMIEMIYPNGLSVHYTYDVMGNLLSVKDWESRVTSYKYDENNRLIQTNHANGVVEYQKYNIAGQMIELKAEKDTVTILHYTYSFDANGNIVEENNVLKNKANLYKYDVLERLIQKDNNTYTFDKFGNITAFSLLYGDTANNKTFQYGNDNELTRIGNEATTLDKDGNLLTYKLNGKTYIATYDSANRLMNYEGTNYQYDNEGNRISVNTAGGTTEFFVDTISGKYSRILEETTNNASIYYIYGHGLLGQYDTTGDYKTFHYDNRGSTVASTDSTGTITGEASYDEYGVILENTLDTRFLYNGKYGVETDSNGLYYMRARFYNPELKRFMNRDVVEGSISNNQSLNRYAFTNGNPVSFIDPFGLARETAQEEHWGHSLLDAIGFIPLVGEVADLANAVWYLSEGNYVYAGLSASAMIPVLGNATTGGKYAYKGTNKVKNILADKSGYIRLSNPNSASVKRNTKGEVNKSFDFENVLTNQNKLMYNKGQIGIIPNEVRDDLLGKEFKDFDDFREAFWKSVSNSNYSQEFNTSNINRMKNGKAPFAPSSEAYKGQKKYILHHKQPIGKGGEVYNLDNLLVVSPKMHQQILDPKYHFGKKG